MRKVISLILCIALMTVSLPVSTFANQADNSHDELSKDSEVNQIISSVEVTYIPRPTAGELADLSKISVSDGVKISDASKWLVMNTETFELEECQESFTPGDRCWVSIVLNAKEGYAFDNNLTAAINDVDIPYLNFSNDLKTVEMSYYMGIVPPEETTHVLYDGEKHTAFETGYWCEVEGDSTGVDLGKYQFTVSLIDPKLDRWSDDDSTGERNCLMEISYSCMEIEQLSDGEIDSNYLKNAIIPNMLLKGMDISNIKLADDYDGDGLSLIEEYNLDTNPFSKDTDEDDLSDFDEIKTHNTNPLLKDTDNDGLSDGKEIQFGGDPLDAEDTFHITAEYLDASVSIALSGEQAETLNITKLENNPLLPSDMPGFIDDAYSFTVDGDFDTAKLSFKFDSSNWEDTEFDPVIYYFNEEVQELEELPTEINENIASTTVDHFSTYILLNKPEFEKAFEWIEEWATYDRAELIPSLGELYTKAYPKSDVILFIKDSYDTSGEAYSKRLEAARNLIDRLPKNSRAAVVSARLSVEVLQNLTTNFDAVKNKLTTEYFKSPIILSDYSTYDEIKKVISLFDEESSNSYKNIIVLTDGGEFEVLGFDEKLIEAARNAGVTINIVGLTDVESWTYVERLAYATNGKFYDVWNDDGWDEALKNIGKRIDIMTDTDGDGISDYLEERMTLFNGIKIVMDKNNPDTDGDRLYDSEEIELKLTYQGFDEKYLGYGYFIYREMIRIIGKQYSNPLKADSDLDGLSDAVDASPLSFDCVVTEVTDEHVSFNTGNTWSIIKCSAYDVMDHLFSFVDQHVDNPIPIEDMKQILEANSQNSAQSFSNEELAIIGLYNNEGARLYMHNLSENRREDVFQMLTGRDSKYYQHTGFLWWTDWEEVPSETQRGFFKGAVLTEADLNFSIVAFCRTEYDYIDLINTVSVIGACVIGAFVASQAMVVATSEASAIYWYINTFGIKNGLTGYLNMGSQYYYGQEATALENGILSVVEADMADGNLDGVEVAQYGFDFGKMGIYIENPNVQVDWSQYSQHGYAQMGNRGISKELVDTFVKYGKALSQNGGDKFAFITKEGVAIVSKSGKLITTWLEVDYDGSMKSIIFMLFGE